MRDLPEIVRDLREAMQQQAAIVKRIEGLTGELEKHEAEAVASRASCPYGAIVEEWNRRCAARGCKRRNTAGELKAAMLRVWRKYPDLALWRAAFDAVGRSEWWTGGGGWQGTLESFLRPSHYGKFFDEGTGAVAAEPEQAGSNPAGAVPSLFVSAEDVIDELLADRRKPLPEGFPGADPREVRGRDDDEFGRRIALLREWLAGDWRFA